MSDFSIQINKLTKTFSVPIKKTTLIHRIYPTLRRQAFKEQVVLNRVSLNILKGEKVALIGKNGTGKTTLLRILCNILDCCYGEIEMNGKVQALFNAHFRIFPELLVIDSVYVIGAIYGLEREFIETRIDDILQHAKIAQQRFLPVSSLSKGQEKRLVLSVFFYALGDIYIFDESFSNLDKEFMVECELFLKRLNVLNKTVIMTSHDTDLLEDYCTKAIWLDEGRIRMVGNVSEVLNSYKDAYCHINTTS